jgi:hypothetical protein
MGSTGGVQILLFAFPVSHLPSGMLNMGCPATETDIPPGIKRVDRQPALKLKTSYKETRHLTIKEV